MSLNEAKSDFPRQQHSHIFLFFIISVYSAFSDYITVSPAPPADASPGGTPTTPEGRNTFYSRAHPAAAGGSADQ